MKYCNDMTKRVLSVLLMCCVCLMVACSHTSKTGAEDNVKLANEGADAAASAAARVPDCPKAKEWAKTARDHADVAEDQMRRAEELEKQKQAHLAKGGHTYDDAYSQKADQQYKHYEATRQLRDLARRAAGEAIKAADECAGRAEHRDPHSPGQDIFDATKQQHQEP